MAAPFLYQHRVTYAECTVGNHVYYSRYLDLLEAARGEFFRHLGAPLTQLQERNLTLPVLECRLRYRAPARYDNILTTEVWLKAVEGIRLTFAYRIVNDQGQLLVDAETEHVSATCGEKPCRLPEELALQFQAHLRPESA
jgi:acyl-CoA thioester hydrolase